MRKTTKLVTPIDAPVDTKKLKHHLERVFNVKAEIKTLNEDIKQIYIDADKDGINKRVFTQAIKVRALQTRDRTALETAMDIV